MPLHYAHTERGFFFAVSGVFVLFWLLAAQTPMHSDDFFYALQGLDWEKHVEHYVSWNGRLYANVLAGVLLSFQSLGVKAFLTAGAATLYLYTLASLPPQRLVLGQMNRAQAFLLITLCYWAGNSALGQTTFWIVGSANYLWTHLTCVLFLKYFFRFIEHPALWRFAGVAVLAVLAGMGNENTTVFLPVISCALLWWYAQAGVRLPRSAFIVPLLNVVGAAVLLLAPGNSVRALSEGAEWYARGFFDRFDVHMRKRFAPALGRSYPVLLVMGVFAWLQRKSGIPGWRHWFFPGLFFVCGVGSFFVMLVAPFFVARARSGGLMFFLCSLAFLLAAYRVPLGRMRYVPRFAVGVLGLFCMLSYTCMYVSYSRCMVQDDIRRSMLYTAKAAGVTHVRFPAFYNGFVMRGGDKFSQFHNQSIAAFYGLDSVEVDVVEFDFGLLRQPPWRVPVSQKSTVAGERMVPSALSIPRVYAAKDFFRSTSVVVAEVAGTAESLALLMKQPVQMRCMTEKGKIVPTRGTLDRQLYCIDGKYIVAQRLKGNFADVAKVELMIGGETLEAVL